MQRRHHQVGSINQRLIKLKQGQKTAFPFPLMVSPCLVKGKHSSLPYPLTPTNTKHQLKTIQKIEYNLAYMDYAMIFCLWFYW